MRPLAGALALIMSVGAAPAAADDMPALVRIVGPYAKVFMYVDDRVLGVRGLTEHCTGETRAWAATIAAAEMARLEALPGELARFGRRYDIGGIVGDRYYSVIRMSATDIDGTYNAFDIDTLIWDTTTDAPVSPAVFFEELADGGPTMTALAAAAKAGLKNRLNSLNATAIAAAPEPTLAGIGPITLARSTMPGKSAGLNFHYPVFTPGRFAPVHLVVFMPWQEFSRYLSRRGRAIFGGAWKEREIYGD
jgi:hypothetical protein